MRMITGPDGKRLRIDVGVDHKSDLFDKYAIYLAVLANRLGGDVEITPAELAEISSVEYSFADEESCQNGVIKVNLPNLPPKGYKSVCVTRESKHFERETLYYWAYSQAEHSRSDPIFHVPIDIESGSVAEIQYISNLLNSNMDGANYAYIGNESSAVRYQAPDHSGKMYLINDTVKFVFDSELQFIESRVGKELLEPKEARILKYILDNNIDGQISALEILDDNWDIWSDKKVLQKVLSILRKKLKKVGMIENGFVAQGVNYKITLNGVLIEQPITKPGLFRRLFGG